MGLLSDNQKAVLEQIRQGTAEVGATCHKITDLVNEVYRRDEDLAAMNPTAETATDLLNRAKARYAELRAQAITAANALPDVQ